LTLSIGVLVLGLTVESAIDEFIEDLRDGAPGHSGAFLQASFALSGETPRVHFRFCRHALQCSA
jgi:hypothetical protein